MDWEPNMEKRISQRVQVGITAYVSRDNGPRWSCRTGNVSSRGAFLEVSGHNLTEGNLLRLALVISRGAVARVFMRDAVVVRAEPQGVGIAFSGVARTTVPAPVREVGQT